MNAETATRLTNEHQRALGLPAWADVEGVLHRVAELARAGETRLYLYREMPSPNTTERAQVNNLCRELAALGYRASCSASCFCVEWDGPADYYRSAR